MVRPPSGCLVQLTDAGMEQNLLAVSARWETIWVALAIEAFYAGREKPYKHG